MAGLRLAEPVAAGKKKKPKPPSVAERTEAQRELCKIGGGTQAVLDGPNGGNITECKGGDSDGWTCINTKKASRCAMQRTNPPTKPGGTIPDQPLQPADPTGGEPSGGGSGSGAGWTPPLDHIPDQPLQPTDPGDSDGGGVILYAYHGSTHDHAKHRGARRRHGRGKGHKR